MTNEIDQNYPQFIRLDLKIKNDYLIPLIDKNAGTCFSGQEQGHVLILAAVFGFLNKNRKKTNKSTDIRLYRSISNDYKVLIRSLVLAESNYDYNILSNGTEVLKIIEEYANGGFPLLYQKIYDKNLDLSIEDEVIKLLNNLEKNGSN